MSFIGGEAKFACVWERKGQYKSPTRVNVSKNFFSFLAGK
jgi:hypothetical protein